MYHALCMTNVTSFDKHEYVLRTCTYMRSTSVLGHAEAKNLHID